MEGWSFLALAVLGRRECLQEGGQRDDGGLDDADVLRRLLAGSSKPQQDPRGVAQRVAGVFSGVELVLHPGHVQGHGVQAGVPFRHLHIGASPPRLLDALVAGVELRHLVGYLEVQETHPRLALRLQRYRLHHVWPLHVDLHHGDADVPSREDAGAERKVVFKGHSRHRVVLRGVAHMLAYRGCLGGRLLRRLVYLHDARGLARAKARVRRNQLCGSVRLHPRRYESEGLVVDLDFDGEHARVGAHPGPLRERVYAVVLVDACSLHHDLVADRRTAECP
mmetsp:Transcript_65473/g.188675  ORF Transcript_65473/g.188675 Transcript_65473/m.188675 type:complete len:279 (-) Transcript_65473:1385-2221(-)